MIKKLLPYMKKYKWQAILSPIIMIVDVFGDILIPYLMSLIVDVGIANQDTEYILKIGLSMTLVALVATILGIYSTHLGATAGFGFAGEIRRDAYRKVQSFSSANLDKLPSSTLITRITNDCNTLGQVAMMTLRMAVRSPFLLLFALIMSYRVNPSLARVFLFVIPIMVLGTFLILKKVRPLFEKMQERVDGLNSVVQENLTGIRVVKSFNRQEYAEDKFKEKNDALQDTSLQAINLMVTMMPLMNLLIYGCILAVLWFGGHQVIEGTMKKGALISFITYITQILMAMMMLTMYFMQATRGAASAKRLIEVLETKADILSPEQALYQLEDGSVEFKNLCFSYPKSSELALKNINLFIASGETLGIIGSTGSAKTSLVQLIPRLYDATQGEVLVGGKNVKDYELKSLRDQVAFVLQANTLFSGTLRENMLWGDKEASDEKIRWALEKAQAWEFVKDYHDGLDHSVEQGGTNYSGGQRQRLSIARSLMKNPKIIILDDSTSAVDVATDAKIRKAFSQELAGITTIIIAQRISSVKDAKRILVLEEGEISALGTHDELLESSKVYKEIYASQQKGLAS
ncbi:MAG: ABC transporter ATP-binding protein [Tissierellia bacterium]|nr:ABC transporter ATP-binding protein [Tissierellia bacterium]